MREVLFKLIIKIVRALFTGSSPEPKRKRYAIIVIVILLTIAAIISLT